MFYTQALVIVEFLFSLSVIQQANSEFYASMRQFLLKYYIGFYIAHGDDMADLLAHFLPKILILLCVMSYIQKEVLLKHFSNGSPPEPIQVAYKRFVLGQYDIDLDQITQIDIP
jgi:hypothetical protein